MSEIEITHENHEKASMAVKVRVWPEDLLSGILAARLSRINLDQTPLVVLLEMNRLYQKLEQEQKVWDE